MKKYLANIWLNEVIEIAIVSETDKMVTILCHDQTTRKELKVTQFGSYHDTFQEAKDALLAFAEKEFRDAQNRFDYTKKRLEKANLL